MHKAPASRGFVAPRPPSRDSRASPRALDLPEHEEEPGREEPVRDDVDQRAGDRERVAAATAIKIKPEVRER